MIFFLDEDHRIPSKTKTLHRNTNTKTLILMIVIQLHWCQDLK